MNKECFKIDKSIYAVPMKIGDILDIIPFYPLSFSLPSRIRPVVEQKNVRAMLYCEKDIIRSIKMVL